MGASFTPTVDEFVDAADRWSVAVEQVRRSFAPVGHDPQLYVDPGRRAVDPPARSAVEHDLGDGTQIGLGRVERGDGGVVRQLPNAER